MHVAWVTNIPTPYRHHQYRRMHAVFASKGQSVEIAYMAESEPGRHWKHAEADFDYPHRFFAGIHPLIRGVVLHANPGLFAWLRRTPPDVLIVGGWASPSHLLAPLCVPKRTKRVLFVESHLTSVARKGALAAAVKRGVIGAYDAYLTASERAIELVTHLDPSAAGKPFHVLPNLIDGSKFVAKTPESTAAARARLGVADDEVLLFTPARLEPFKGLDLALPAFAGRQKLRWLIAGEGSKKADYEATIARDRSPVTLLGQRPEAEIIGLLHAADVFFLPSRSDPAPLSVVEATATGNPLLLSQRVGNLEQGLGDENGWSYDIEDPAALPARLDAIQAEGRAGLAARGARSRARYVAKFDSDRNVAALAEWLATL